MKRLLWTAVGTLAIAAGPRAQGPVSSAPSSLACFADRADVRWERSRDPRELPTLDRWCASVGAPVVVRPPSKPAEIRRLIVASWNLHVGGGRFEDLIGSIAKDASGPENHVGVVVLLQEAFRAGLNVPAAYPEDLRVPAAIRARRPVQDLPALAEAYGLFGVYVPSMRNGPATDESEREDRGNAILSTEPIGDIVAMELPFGKQRRVAVSATVTPRGGAARSVRVVSFHFDTSSARAVQARALAARLKDMAKDGQPVIAGGDLNSLRGFDDEAFKALEQSVPVERCGTDRTNTWPGRLDVPFGWWRGRLDFIFSTLDAHDVDRSCGTGRSRFGSDHHPVVLTVTLPQS
jgi:endonuclease/exonuclease/phosphatase family metal-dependent hydrolase